MPWLLSPPPGTFFKFTLKVETIASFRSKFMFPFPYFPFFVLDSHSLFLLSWRVRFNLSKVSSSAIFPPDL